MNFWLNEYFKFCFELNIELNHFWAQFNVWLNNWNVSNRASKASYRTSFCQLCLIASSLPLMWSGFRKIEEEKKFAEIFTTYHLQVYVYECQMKFSCLNFFVHDKPISTKTLLNFNPVVFRDFSQYAWSACFAFTMSLFPSCDLGNWWELECDWLKWSYPLVNISSALLTLVNFSQCKQYCIGWNDLVNISSALFHFCRILIFHLIISRDTSCEHSRHHHVQNLG